MDHWATSRWKLRLLTTTFIACTLHSVVGNDGFNFHTLSDAEEHSVNVGGSLTLKCNTTLDSAVNWLFDSKDGQINGKKIAHNGVVVPNKRHHFAMESHSKGVYNLILLIASRGDAGTYICVEDDGFGPGTIVHHVTVAEPIELDVQKQLPQRRSATLFSSGIARNAGSKSQPALFFPCWLLLLAWWSH